MVNRELQAARPGRNYQSLQTKQYWLLVQKGIEEPPPRPDRDESGIPWHEPPDWFKPYLANQEIFDDCPF